MCVCMGIYVCVGICVCVCVGIYMCGSHGKVMLLIPLVLPTCAYLFMPGKK